MDKAISPSHHHLSTDNQTEQDAAINEAGSAPTKQHQHCSKSPKSNDTTKVAKNNEPRNVAASRNQSEGCPGKDTQNHSLSGIYEGDLHHADSNGNNQPSSLGQQ